MKRLPRGHRSNAPRSGSALNAKDPRNGQLLGPNSSAAIGTPIPGSGNPLNGIRQAGDGIAKTGYTWPAIVVGPRFGVAYDISGNQMTVLRAGGGIYYDRPDGNTVFSIPGNPPIANSADLRYGQLQTLTQGLNILKGDVLHVDLTTQKSRVESQSGRVQGTFGKSPQKPQAPATAPQRIAPTQ